jgi:PAS domain S-box-containing protein
MASASAGGISPTTRYALFGAAFGAVFPFVATVVDMGLLGLPFSLGGFLDVQATQPLLWIIDATPLVTGLFAARLGRTQEELADLQRSAHERRLASEIDRFFTLSPLAMAIIELENGAFRRINPAFTHLFGYTIDALGGQTIPDLVHEGDRASSQERSERARRGELIEMLVPRINSPMTRAAPNILNRWRRSFGRLP